MKCVSDLDYYSTVFYTTMLLPMIECDECKNIYSFRLPFNISLDDTLTTLIRHASEETLSIKEFYDFSTTLLRHTGMNIQPVELLAGGFVVPVTWRTLEAPELDFYRYPLLFDFDHISRQLEAELVSRQLAGFKLFEIRHELVDEDMNVLSKQSTFRGFMPAYGLSFNHDISSHSCRSCRQITEYRAKTFTKTVLSVIDCLVSSDVWNVDEVGRIYSNRFADTCKDFSVGNLLFETLSEEECQQVLACNQLVTYFPE